MILPPPAFQAIPGIGEEEESPPDGLPLDQAQDVPEILATSEFQEAGFREILEGQGRTLEHLQQEFASFRQEMVSGARKQRMAQAVQRVNFVML